MGIRSYVALVATILLAAPRFAHADPKGDVQTKIKEAMESYDLMDYEVAKKLLNQAVATAKKSKLDKDPVVARAYLDLGIVGFAIQDQEAARISFLSAVQIDPKIQIDAAYKSADMAKLLDEARREAAGSGGTATAGGGGDDAVDCTGVKGLQHEIVDTAKGGAALKLEAKLGGDVKATKVSIQYRVEGASDFVEAPMTKSGCKLTGQIPGAAMKGGLVHYYVAAYDSKGKVLVGKGSAGSPNIIEITAGGGAAGKAKVDDNEDPLGGGKRVAKAEPVGGGGGGGSDGGDIDKGTTVTTPKKQKVNLGVSVGTGFGYVRGNTEGGNTVKNCCIGNSLVVIQPELSVVIKPKLSIGIAGRIGVPLGANVEGHATLAPAVLARLRYSLADNGEGIRIMGQLGAGILRNTIKLDTSMPTMDTDVVAQGPLLVGGGVGYKKQLGGGIAFLAEGSALAGIAVTKTLGTPFNSPALNSGITADLTLGLAVGF